MPIIMLLFWILIAVLTCLALAFVIWPLLHVPETSLADGAARLDNTRGFGVALLVIVVLPVAALWLYLHWGASQQLAEHVLLQKHAAAIKAELKQLHSPQQVIDTLTTHLRRAPNSAKGWYLLGRLYLTIGKYHAAAVAFKKANQLTINQPGIMLGYAQALFFANDRHLNNTAEHLLKTILQRDPHQVNALNLLAVNAYLRGDYRRAVNYWEQLQNSFAPDSKSAKAIRHMIALAQRKLLASPAADQS